MNPKECMSICAEENYCGEFMYKKTHYIAPQEKTNDER
jgi:hypothetical protein